MTLRRMALAVASCPGSLVLAPAIAALLLSSAGCSSGERATAPAPAIIEVTGTLIALEDYRPVDGGVDLTLEIRPGYRVVGRVPSVFRKPPNEPVVAMHRVVDAAKLGDRLRGRGKRDEGGALWFESLEIVER